jgi:hypothetical protein
MHSAKASMEVLIGKEQPLNAPMKSNHVEDV